MNSNSAPKRRRRCKPSILKGYDHDYISLPEYPQYRTITVMPLKTIYENLDADPRANDFYVARGYSDPMIRKIEKKIGMEVYA